MASGHSVLNMLNQNSKAGIEDAPKGRFRTKDIPIANIYRNERNFYGVREVEELAGKILMAGLLENLVVVYDPGEKGEYRLISGERRLAALHSLVESGHDEFNIATCNIRPKATPEEEEFELITANSQRHKTPDEELQEEERLKAVIEAMKAQGQKIKGFDLTKGRLRDVVAKMLGKSPTKIAQMESINHRLIPEWRERLANGGITFSAAYQISGMPEPEQRLALTVPEDDAALSPERSREKEDNPSVGGEPAPSAKNEAKPRKQPEEERTYCEPQHQVQFAASGSACQNVTQGTRCVDKAICPACGEKFDPDEIKESEWGRDYSLICPNCGVRLEIFESVEYQAALSNAEQDG